MDHVEDDDNGGRTPQNVGRIWFGKPKPHNERRHDANDVAGNA